MTDKEKYDKAKQIVKRIEYEGINSWATSVGYQLNIATMNKLAPKLGYGVYNDIRKKKPIKQSNMEIKNQKEHLNALLAEIEVLKSRFEPTDTGHIRTAVNVLEDRVQEIINSL